MELWPPVKVAPVTKQPSDPSTIYHTYVWPLNQVYIISTWPLYYTYGCIISYNASYYILLKQLPIYYKKQAYSYHILGQSTNISQFFRDSVCKCLLTSFAHSSPPTSQNPTIMKYETSLCAVLEDFYEYDTKFFLKRSCKTLSLHKWN
jgi:hypothetical protein